MTMETVQTTIFNILLNQKHRIELDGITILFIYSNWMFLSQLDTRKYLQNLPLDG